MRGRGQRAYFFQYFPTFSDVKKAAPEGTVHGYAGDIFLSREDRTPRSCPRARGGMLEF